MAPLCGSGMRWAHCKPGGISPRAIRPADNSPSRRHCLSPKGEHHTCAPTLPVCLSVYSSAPKIARQIFTPGHKAEGERSFIPR